MLGYSLPPADKRRIWKAAREKCKVPILELHRNSAPEVLDQNVFYHESKTPEDFLDMHPEMLLPAEQKQAWLQTRTGAIVGRKTAERFHWKIGDKIPIKTTIFGGNATWDFNLDGIYHSERAGGDESQFWFQWDAFEEGVPKTFKDHVGWYVLKIENPDDAPRIAKAIDEMFNNSDFETKTETESAFAAGWVKQFGNIEFLILSIGGVVFFTLLLVTGNTMAISVRERVGELATLKAIGYGDRTILFFVLAESLMISLIGGLIGLGLAALAIPVLASALNGLLPTLILSPAILSVGLGTALLVGLVSGLLPGIGAMRMRVVNALRRV